MNYIFILGAVAKKNVVFEFIAHCIVAFVSAQQILFYFLFTFLVKLFAVVDIRLRKDLTY